MPRVQGQVTVYRNGTIHSCCNVFAQHLVGHSATALINTPLGDILPDFSLLYHGLQKEPLSQTDKGVIDSPYRMFLPDPSVSMTKNSCLSLTHSHEKLLPVLKMHHKEGHSRLQVELQLSSLKNSDLLQVIVTFNRATALSSSSLSFHPLTTETVPETVPGPSIVSTTMAPLHSKDSTLNDYTLLNTLGEGAYGSVHRAVHRSDPEHAVAIKYAIKSRIQVDWWMRDRVLGVVPTEVHIMNTLRKDPHPNCGTLLGSFEDDNHVYIVMELNGTGMDLFEYIEIHYGLHKHTKHLFLQIASAVQHLHRHRIVHRDIKDENIVMDDQMHVWLIDFGSAAYVKSNKPFTTVAGTLDYAAPEVLQGEAYEGYPQDIWALGILLYTLVYGENPFYNKSYEFSAPHVEDAECVDLIKKMLCIEVKDRLTIDQVLQHTWLV
ncbi:kinase-like domain-containing protein [Spinellus fusiger]|nr:kinase-like domain-containing protein [Spinellus fusiger]